MEKRKYTDDRPCPPIVSSAKGNKTDPVAADGVVLDVFALLRAHCAGEGVVAGIVFLWARLVAKGSMADELLVGDPHTVGRRDVEEQFRAAGLSMVVTPERRMSVC